MKQLYPLKEYLAAFERAGVLSAAADDLNQDGQVTFLSYHSQQVVPGTLFFCKGERFSIDFLRQAQENGAICYVSEVVYPEVTLPYIKVSDMRRALSPAALLYFNHPSQQIPVVGITGTKGKTTTTYFLKNILSDFQAAQGGNECGILSSVDTYDGVERYRSTLTTPEVFELQRNLSNARDCNLGHVVMECSSQALKYHRSAGTQFEVAVFTNITEDHISPIEHPDYEDYLAAKLNIFSQSKHACINLDSNDCSRILDAARKTGQPVLTFSQKDPAADVFADEIRKEDDLISFRVRTPQYTQEVSFSMPGLFNVSNALGAIAVCQFLNIPVEFIKSGLLKTRVPGRMEFYISGDKKVTAIVDFAHNDISFQTLFESVKKEYPTHRIVSVFGSPGGKALNRKRGMTLMAAKYCDEIYITEDDPGREQAEDICAQLADILQSETTCPYKVIVNRNEATRRAIIDCTEKSVVLVLAKGVEDVMKRGFERVPVPTDGQNVQAFLAEYDATHN